MRLERAGAEIAILAANTPHMFFDVLRERSPIPLVSIVEAARDRAEELGAQTVGLLGTRITMNATFYPEVFSQKNIAVVVPGAEDVAVTHDIYMNELFHGVVLDESRQRLLAIVERMKQSEGIEAIVLGGTELSLIVRDPTFAGIPALDTTRIHVDRVLSEILGEAKTPHA